MSDLAGVVARLREITVALRTRGQAAGSGVIWRADGLVVTSAHVVASAHRSARRHSSRAGRPAPPPGSPRCVGPAAGPGPAQGRGERSSHGYGGRFGTSPRWRASPGRWLPLRLGRRGRGHGSPPRGATSRVPHRVPLDSGRPATRARQLRRSHGRRRGAGDRRQHHDCGRAGPGRAEPRCPGFRDAIHRVVIRVAVVASSPMAQARLEALVVALPGLRLVSLPPSPAATRAMRWTLSSRPTCFCWIRERDPPRLSCEACRKPRAYRPSCSWPAVITSRRAPVVCCAPARVPSCHRTRRRRTSLPR